jgi:glycosyltransferase involved in cell wall biosynthesis
LLEQQLRHVDAIIAMSEFSRAKHSEFGFMREMEVINYFLPDVPVAPPATPPPHPRPYFLFVGRLERIKGLDDVIPVFREYRDADLLVIGEGEHGPTLRRLAEGCDRVRFLGRLPPNELNRYYQQALALIVPSVCFETFGIIVIEAFRQGTPVLARRLGPLPEIVQRGGGGLLFDGADDLTAAMRSLSGSPEARARLATAARESFVANWSEPVVVRQYLDLVDRIAREKSHATPGDPAFIGPHHA